MPPSTKPSSNWLSLQKNLVRPSHPRKRRKIDRGGSSEPSSDKTSAKTSFLQSGRHGSDSRNEDVDLETTEMKNGESIAALRRMVLGKMTYEGGSQTAPGKYLALDCEMVGVGIDGNESSLARVSIVNYTGAIILDVFVRQRERVVDYRTQWSGVRSTDLAGSAKPFTEVQQTVAKLIKDRILVGHAIYNDLKALLLSQPSQRIRDTQSLAYKHRVVKSRRPALRVLVKQELGIVIQGGEHNSVTDARATMAIFRLHKKQWESGFRSFFASASLPTKNKADQGPTGKAVALRQPSPSPRPSLIRGRKRGHSESSWSNVNGTDELAMLSQSSRPRTPSPPVGPRDPTHHAFTSNRRERRTESRPSIDSTDRKGISSGISTVVRRTSGIKEIRKKGQKGERTAHGVVKERVVGYSSNGRKQASKGGDKWWKTLGRGKTESIEV